MHHEKPSLLISTCVTAVTVAILFLGCSKPFVPYFSSKSAVEDTQVTHHWDVFAADVAGQIKLSLDNAGIYDILPMYVETSKGTPFGESFSELLTVRLEEMGFTVTEEKTEAVFIINNTIRVICHVARQITDPLTGSSAMFARLSEGVTVARGSGKNPAGADLQAADDDDEIEFTGDFPPTEVLITTNLYNDTDVLMQNSDIYYIKDPDFWCYVASPQIHEQSPEQAAHVEEQTIEGDTPQTPEQISESSTEVVPVPVSTQTTDQSTGEVSEKVMEEVPKPLPELKVKGHF
ncbi:hypothetical protein ACFL7E_02715 [Thermodesulfobacteriota bacterium]